MNKLDELLWHMNAQCSDGGCIFRPSDMKGMVTNGGCRCAGDYGRKHNLELLIRWMKSNGRFDEQEECL